MLLVLSFPRNRILRNQTVRPFLVVPTTFRITHSARPRMLHVRLRCTFHQPFDILSTSHH